MVLCKIKEDRENYEEYTNTCKCALPASSSVMERSSPLHVRPRAVKEEQKGEKMFFDVEPHLLSLEKRQTAETQRKKWREKIRETDRDCGVFQGWMAAADPRLGAGRDFGTGGCRRLGY